VRESGYLAAFYQNRLALAAHFFSAQQAWSRAITRARERLEKIEHAESKSRLGRLKEGNQPDCCEIPGELLDSASGSAGGCECNGAR